MHSFHFGALLHASFFDDRFAPRTEPLDIFDAWTAREEDGRNGLVREVVLFTIGLEARFDVEGAWTMVAANQLSAIFAMVAVVSIFNFWLRRL
jgi:hypothetical protein